MKAVREGKLSETQVNIRDEHACCVIMASKGYPESYEKGFEISIPAEIKDKVYVAGAKLSEGKLLTNGGRVLGVTEKADSLKEAIDKAYADVEKIHFDNAYYRHDIGARAMKAAAEV